MFSKYPQPVLIATINFHLVNGSPLEFLYRVSQNHTLLYNYFQRRHALATTIAIQWLNCPGTVGELSPRRRVTDKYNKKRRGKYREGRSARPSAFAFLIVDSSSPVAAIELKLKSVVGLRIRWMASIEVATLKTKGFRCDWFKFYERRIDSSWISAVYPSAIQPIDRISGEQLIHR